MELRATNVAEAYARARPATQATPGGPGETLLTAGRDFAATLREGEETARAALTAGADPHALVQALAQTELAVETAVTIRNRVVEAYQELLRMPV